MSKNHHIPLSAVIFLLTVAVSPAQPPPPPITDLTITIDSSSIILNWSPIPGTEYYNIYRSSEPYFIPSGIPLISVTQTTWYDTNAINYSPCYYIVTSEGEYTFVEWERTFGGTGCDVAYSVQQTFDGGYIIGGCTSSYGAGDNDIWLLKTNSAGDSLWSHTFGGNGTDVGRCAQQTSDGGYIIGGSSNSFSTGGNDYDVYLIKTDEFGNEQWNRTFGDSLGQFAEWVQQTPDGGYIITGQAIGTTSVWDVLLLKTDDSGNEIWTHTFDISYADCGETVKLTQDGGYIIAGWTDSGSSNALLLKTDSLGNEIWHHSYGGGASDHGECGQQTMDGGYIIAGWTQCFGAGSYDVYLVKTDSAGSEQWSHTYGWRLVENGLSVQQTLDSGYIIAGWTTSAGAGAEDFYLVKTDSTGSEQWSYTFGGESQDIAWSIQQTQDTGYIIAGYTYSYGAGSNDVYLIKTGTNP